MKLGNRKNSSEKSDFSSEDSVFLKDQKSTNSLVQRGSNKRDELEMDFWDETRTTPEGKVLEKNLKMF